MGLDKLAGLILQHVDSVKKKPNLKSYSGKVVALDGSARLLKCKHQGTRGSFDYMIYYFMQTVLELENGVKPVYVFNGSGPSGKIKDSEEVRMKVKEQFKNAKNTENTKEVYKFRKQLTKYNSQHVEDIKRLLWLIGIPIIDAPGEAEAQCASLVHTGHAFATVSEDVASLVYGSDVLLRDMRSKPSRQKIAQHKYVQEIPLDEVLETFKLNYQEFIDFTVLIGCDYSDSIKLIGPCKALKLIQKYHNIESCIDVINAGEYVIPEGWNYKEAREKYAKPLVREVNQSDLEWKTPDYHGVIDYLCRYYRFDQVQVKNALAKL